MTTRTEELLAARKGNAMECPVQGCDGTHIVNVPLLRKIYEHIDAHPEEWNQSYWGLINVVDVPLDQKPWTEVSAKEVEQLRGTCNTAFCIAGHSVSLAGIGMKGVMVITDDGKKAVQVDYTTEKSAEGLPISVEEYASHVLGLDSWESETLFGGDNTKADVLYHCKQFAKSVGDEF